MLFVGPNALANQCNFMFIVSVAVDILFNVLPFFAEVLCLCFVMYYFVPWVGLQCVIVVSPDQTDLLFGLDALQSRGNRYKRVPILQCTWELYCLIQI